MAALVADTRVVIESDSDRIQYEDNSLLQEEQSSDTEVELPDTRRELDLQPSELEEKLRGYEIIHTRRRNNMSTEGSSVDRQTPDSCGPVTTPPDPLPCPNPPLLRHPERAGFWGGLLACLQPVTALLHKDQLPQVKKDLWEIPFADIRELDFIGSGSQGAVFVGEYRGEKVAVKKVKEPSYCEGIRHLRKLSHPNIVAFK